MKIKIFLIILITVIILSCSKKKNDLSYGFCYFKLNKNFYLLTYKEEINHLNDSVYYWHFGKEASGRKRLSISIFFNNKEFKIGSLLYFGIDIPIKYNFKYKFNKEFLKKPCHIREVCIKYSHVYSLEQLFTIWEKIYYYLFLDKKVNQIIQERGASPELFDYSIIFEKQGTNLICKFDCMFSDRIGIVKISNGIALLKDYFIKLESFNKK